MDLAGSNDHVTRSTSMINQPTIDSARRQPNRSRADKDIDKMASTNDPTIPRRNVFCNRQYIEGPGHESFTARFGNAFPEPYFLDSDLGATAVYDIVAPSTQVKHQVLMIHGINTPALGLLPLAKEIQARNADTHIVLFDLWGHGLSSTPLTAHTPHVFHSQILQVLAHLGWSHAHIIGFSFGGATAATFAVYHPRVPLSVALIAPAGLLSRSDLGQELSTLLEVEGRDMEATDAVLAWLGAGSSGEHEDWNQQMRSGQVVAKVLKQWELDEHDGYRHSVLSMIRDGGVFDCEWSFQRLVRLPLKTIVVLGELDDVCSQAQLEALGVDRIEVVKGADHEVVRTRAVEIARIIHEFWRGM